MPGSYFAPDFTTPIGGGHFRASGPTGVSGTSLGGYIDIYGNIQDDEPIFSVSMDVVEWSLEEVFENQPLECSGNLGATDARLTGYSYMFKAIVVRDINCPPDAKLRGIAGCQLVFWLGDVTEGVASTASNGAKVKDRYYWTPDAVLHRCTPMVRSKQSNRDLIVGFCRSHVFLCPEMGDPIGDPNADDTIAGAYNKFYNG